MPPTLPHPGLLPAVIFPKMEKEEPLSWAWVKGVEVPCRLQEAVEKLPIGLPVTISPLPLGLEQL